MLKIIERQIQAYVDAGNQPVPAHLLEYRDYLINKQLLTIKSK